MIQVTAAVIEQDDKFLIVRRKKGKSNEHKWEFPGGKIEPNETPQQCLARELHEELGISAQVDEYLTESRFHYRDIEYCLMAYRTRWVSGEYELRDHDRLEWVTTSELSQYDFTEADVKIVSFLQQ